MNRRLGKRKRQRMAGQNNQQPDTGTDTGQPSNQKQGGSGDENLRAAPLGSEIHTPESKRENGNANQRDKHILDYLTAIFAFIAAIGGVVAGIAGGYQGLIARDSEIVSNRAFVSSTDFQLINYGDKASGHTQWIIAPMIENTGATATRFLKINSTTNSFVGRGWNFHEMDKEPFATGIIGPRSNILGGIFGFTAVNVGQFQLNILSAGTVKYEDIFQKRHITEFCYRFFLRAHIDWEGYPAGQPIRSTGAITDECANHNCADGECGPDWEKRAKE
jgi:hypothetical protein